MKLSTRGRYGARAMLELALGYENRKELVQLREIAQRQEISERYLERMMAALVSIGLVISSRGRNGGFRLAKPPWEIRLSQIIRAVEGSIAPVPCIDDPGQCNRIDTCVTYDIWERISKGMSEILDSVTLQDMVEMQKKKLAKTKAYMYHI